MKCSMPNISKKPGNQSSVVKKRKRGPKEERLIIEGEPDDALRELLKRPKSKKPTPAK